MKELLLSRKEKEYCEGIRKYKELKKDFQVFVNNSEVISSKNQQLALENKDLQEKLGKLNQKFKITKQAMQNSQNRKKSIIKTKKTINLHSTL